MNVTSKMNASSLNIKFAFPIKTVQVTWSTGSANKTGVLSLLVKLLFCFIFTKKFIFYKMC